jgi:hypothetical protein
MPDSAFCQVWCDFPAFPQPGKYADGGRVGADFAFRAVPKLFIIPDNPDILIVSRASQHRHKGGFSSRTGDLIGKMLFVASDILHSKDRVPGEGESFQGGRKVLHFRSFSILSLLPQTRQGFFYSPYYVS